uniref:BPTI/Kunitz inhibitor domain-containing protein n=1 Tax=Romanomermis culicivorax TaxID=13658 RepID=A0A915JYB1_ROMCU
MNNSLFLIFVSLTFACSMFGDETGPAAAAPKDGTEDGPFLDFGTDLVNPCILDKDAGAPADGNAEERWFFDKQTKQCEKFDFYQGGNENNFISKEDCEQVCNS